jgi:hypothetical protein
MGLSLSAVTPSEAIHKQQRSESDSHGAYALSHRLSRPVSNAFLDEASVSFGVNSLTAQSTELFNEYSVAKDYANAVLNMNSLGRQNGEESNQARLPDSDAMSIISKNSSLSTTELLIARRKQIIAEMKVKLDALDDKFTGKSKDTPNNEHGGRQRTAKRREHGEKNTSNYFKNKAHHVEKARTSANIITTSPTEASNAVWNMQFF